MSQAASLKAEIVENLLTLPTLEQRAAFLHAADLLDATGLTQLLERAAQSVATAPGQSRRLSLICAELADRAGAPAVVPQAAYLRAQTHAIEAEFDQALELIEAARQGYIGLGQTLEALRTNIGLMTVLNELGRPQDALNAGQVVLNGLHNTDKHAERSEEGELLAALAYQNCGIAYELTGRYDEALVAYATAESYYRHLGLTKYLGEISLNRGVVLLNLGRGSEALAAFELAATIGAEANLTLLHAQALINTGNAHLLLGHYSRSLSAFEQARRLFESLEALADEYVLLLDTAETYLALNLYPEALAAYREVEGLLQNAGMAHERARALRGMALALVAQSKFGEAEPVLAEATALFHTVGDLPFLSGVKLEQAEILAAQGEREAALTTIRQALELISANEWPMQQISAHLRLADLFLPDLAAAEQHLLSAQQLSGNLMLPHLRYRLNQRLGAVRWRQGRTAEAQTLLEAAVEQIEQWRSTLTAEVMRASFLRDKMAAYENLIQVYLAHDDEKNTQRAFYTAERAKSRTLVELMAGIIDPKEVRQLDPELAARLQNLQADLNGVYNKLLDYGGESKSKLLGSSLQTRAAELEQEISRLRLQAASAAPTINPFETSLSLEAIQAQLPLDIILLSYYICDNEIMAFVNVQGQMRLARRLGSITEVQRLLQRLAIQWDRFRAGPTFVNQHLNQLEQSARRLLTSLYTLLIEPLEIPLAEAAEAITGQPYKLVIVPHGPLHQIPFHALFDGEQYLLERFEISYAPSATVFALGHQRVPKRSGSALVFGVSDPLIPAVAAETRAVAQFLDSAEVYTDAQAKLGILQAKATSCSILHLACHGLFRADNPMFSALKLGDGWLTAADVMQFDLSDALVTLSACESGRSQVIAGDEIIGLTRAFLGAGAATLVVSLWLVQDDTTAALMAAWYEQLRSGLGQAAALRAAQLALKARRPHPYYWAPFVLIGQR